MSSVRSRLIAGFAGTLVATLVVFSIALWVARRARQYDELERYVIAQANLAVRIIRGAEAAGEPVTTVASDSGATVAPTLRGLLDPMPDYVLVLGSIDEEHGATETILYRSPQVRQLTDDEVGALLGGAIKATIGGPAALVDVGNEQLLLAVRAPASRESAISRVVVAASTRTADLAARELFGTMLIVAPFLLLGAVGVTYRITGRAFGAVDRMINEVEAITDGRSLHRRLALEGAGDEFVRLAKTLNDMMERLETSFAALRRFTADASHELKTPLAVLRVDVERAMTPSTSSSERMVALEEALQEITRMADLVASLLTLARADEGRFDLVREPVELEPLVREVFETAVILGEDAGLEVRLPVVEPATVLGDVTRLRQLFLNLVTNAVKYTPRGGTVEVTLHRRERTATLSVRDTGIGISAGDLPHVFERFYRADRARSRTSERGGFGLGLAISQWIAEAHGGTIAVRSRLGRGSTFTVTLPVAAAGEPAEITPRSAAHPVGA
ncbi:MAG TPA: HAMP domain-containing sensor histidine kinase [Gemmatimonadaceae bacterium]|nr:HAMP domain-containing sensor histidine kinase [Gemmatimonadaceae bacterium]